MEHLHHHHIHTIPANLSAYTALRLSDPTRTTFLRRAFTAQMAKRFKALRGLIRRALVEQDCLGLLPNTGIKMMAAGDMSLPGRRAFAFPRSQDKVDAFMDWLRHQEEAGILETRQFQQIGRAIEGSWTNTYIYDSYSRGIQRARMELKGAGYVVPTLEESGGIAAIMFSPFHMDRVGVLYSRVFRDLKGITESMDNQISRVLSQGMIDGKGPIELARLLNRTISGPVGDLGITDTLGRFIPAERRAKMLARTEIIRAHHLGNIQEMRNWAVEGVRVKAEWQTAGNPCPLCEEMSLRPKPYTLDEIEGLIPFHPNCRCCAIPLKEDETASEIETTEE